MISTTMRPFLLCGLVLACAGCGGGYKKPLGTVTGQVTCDGKPVKSGYIKFSPVVPEGANSKDSMFPGKTAESKITKKGTYELSTYALRDGAVVGKHTARLFPSDSDVEKGITIPCEGATMEVTVEGGSNTIDLNFGMES
ncbi:hypothetical protein [Stratiformator vulcanicus]|uniref:Carboxypeptidase regulatory-like domain-containing protein n=1 Tax=Stratiformator vulcanicus TaxID=2527980 RepID=A0A517QWM3_9PLAN|nr:hypothetical protein [Stratiformator vulcanicus]QDT36062.1 hypothetical protein Pan189_04170 [Stratiformator vulcanicus]